MEKFASCTWSESANGLFILENVLLPDGPISRIYLGTSGVCGIIDDRVEPRRIYMSLHAILGTTRIFLFVNDSRLYDAKNDALTDAECSITDDLIHTYVQGKVSLHTHQRLHGMLDKLRETDAQTRGYYRDEDGNLYVYRRRKFYPASELDPEQLFRLAAYGGVLGLHRFALRKYFTGLVYFFTCGFFLVGYFLDLLQLFMGTLDDGHKKLLFPFRAQKNRLLRLVPSFAVSTVAFLFYLRLTGSFLDAASQNDVLSPLVQSLLEKFPVTGFSG